LTGGLAAPSPLRDGEVTLLPLDAQVPALLVAASHDHEVTRWTQVPAGMTLLDAGLVTAGWASNPTVVRFQVALADGSRVGMVTVWINADGEAEVGYWLLQSARGRGVARSAVRMLCDWAFATSDVERLQLTTLLGNTSSEKVAAACGFHLAGAVVREVKGSSATLRLWERARGDGVDPPDQREEIGG
jgi:[ribosomal protein S5]-alanine N-acetyltransferase